MMMNKLIDQVDDGFNYFNYRLEELRTDDVYYIKAFMKYIEVLESKLKRKNYE
jgi:tRNA nucleotidyltransferase (CCA-adding enzyme)